MKAPTKKQPSKKKEHTTKKRFFAGATKKRNTPMADVIVTFTIMPESPETDLEHLTTLAKEKITAFAGEGDMRTSQEPVAFGLKKLIITFVADESKGSTEAIEKEIASLPGVSSCECTDVRRAIG
ncbi:elongation factor 1-beta [Candidatus Woesearchaeota archaeon]|nr:MAG: elongation factor 1-beta [Candidatus Woesearchaeota archaeon]